MMTLEGLQIVALEGTPRDRGRAHGETLRPLIATGMERWKDSIHRTTGLRADAYLDRFVEQTDFLAAIQHWTPHLLDEVRGIGEGAGIAFRDIYAYQLMDEEWLFRAAHAQRADGPALEHCSVVGVVGENGAPTILAQNMDLPRYYDGTQTLLRVKHQDSDLEMLVFTPAGLIATTGLNNRGVGLCVNTLAQLRSSTRGLPVAFIARRVLEHHTAEDAVAFVSTVPHASGQNYVIAAPGKLVDLECSASRAVPFAPAATRVYHTNHPLVNDDQPLQTADATAVVFGKGAVAETEPAATVALSNSEQRFVFLENAFGAAATPITVDTVKAILSTCEVPISVARTSAGHGMTLGSLVMELSIPPVLHLAPGPPAETPYNIWTFA